MRFARPSGGVLAEAREETDAAGAAEPPCLVREGNVVLLRDVRFVRSKVSPDVWAGCSAEAAGLAPGAAVYLEDGRAAAAGENGTAPAPRACFVRHPPVWELRLRALAL